MGIAGNELKSMLVPEIAPKSDLIARNISDDYAIKLFGIKEN